MVELFASTQCVLKQTMLSLAHSWPGPCQQELYHNGTNLSTLSCLPQSILLPAGPKTLATLNLAFSSRPTVTPLLHRALKPSPRCSHRSCCQAAPLGKSYSHTWQGHCCKSNSTSWQKTSHLTWVINTQTMPPVCFLN